MDRDILDRLQDIEDDPLASPGLAEVASDAMAEIRALRAMTTDPEEGQRQIEAMQPPKLKVGDKVRLSAGGERVMTVVELRDYDNTAWCCWTEPTADSKLISKGATTEVKRDTFPVRSLVRVEPDKQTG